MRNIYCFFLVFTCAALFLHLAQENAAAQPGEDSTNPIARQEEWVATLGKFQEGVDGWTYNGGWEFPGAKGSVERSVSDSRSGNGCLKLSGDFTHGGAYVAVRKTFSPVTLKELRFWIRGSGINSIGLRIGDKTGQVFQYRIDLESPGQWRQITFKDFDKAAGSWGGANDKKFHQPATSVAFMLGGEADKKPQLFIDAVEAIRPNLDEPWSAAKEVTPPGYPPLSLSCSSESSIQKWHADGHLSKEPELRNKISYQANTFEGKDGILVEVTHPRILQEYLVYPLDKTEDGKVWTEHGYDYLSFWYKTEDADGEIYFLLVGRGGEYSSRVTVRPGKWTQVVLPLADFYSTAYYPTGPYRKIQMTQLAGINKIKILSDANSLRAPGKILFSDFEVSTFSRPDSLRQVDFSPINLDDAWKGKASVSNDDVSQISQGFFDDSRWSRMSTHKNWNSQGIDSADAVWLRANVFIPKQWRGIPISLTGTEGNVCSMWVNGQPLNQDTFTIAVKPDNILPADRINWGGVNTFVIRAVRDKLKDGESPILGSMAIEPKLCVLTLRPKGGSPDQERLPARFDMGAQPPGSLELVFRFPTHLIADKTAKVSFILTDLYFRTLALGETGLSEAGEGQMQAIIPLGKEETRKLYYAEFFEYQLSVKNKDGSVPVAEVSRVTDLCYAGRDAKVLAALPEQWEDTPYGRLKLVDEIDCSADPAVEGHPYKEGGMTWKRWVLRKYYYFWKDGVDVEDILGRKCRVASNSCWFGYRVGRNIKPGRTYILRVEYPEDKPRYAPMDIALGNNYTDPGFKTGVSAKDPFDNFPLSGKYERYDIIVAPDKLGYGYLPTFDKNGDYLSNKSVSSTNGFWVSFIDVGGHSRSYAKSQFAGPAVSRIKLYEIDPEQNAPVINKPKGLPERILMAAWEREPACDPLATAQIAKLMGWNAISPEVLKWHFTAYWPTKLGYVQKDPDIPFLPLPRNIKMDTYREFLDAAQKVGINLIPRIEYGGSEDVPKEARCIGPNGAAARMARFCSWGADLLHPETWKDFERLIDEVIGSYVENYPCLGKGMFWRMRCGRMTISYSQFDVELFCKENNIPLPTGDARVLAKWASSGETGKLYEDWWQKKRAEFNRKVRDKLRSIDPAMKLFYYNWDQDGWMLGNVTPSNAHEWALLYDNETKNWLYEKELEVYAKYKNSDFVKMVQDLNPPIQKAAMENYRKTDGVAFLTPVSLRYVADNPEYLEYFRTGDGLAVDHQVLYEETIAHYAQHDAFEGSMITSGGPCFTMGPELWAWFYGDANTLSFSTYTFGRGFADAHRRFAQAFLALPAISGEVVDQGDLDVKVRQYPSVNGTYVGVAYKGYLAKNLTIRIPVVKKEVEVMDLVTNQAVPIKIAGNNLVFEINASPMELDAFLIK